MELVWKWYLINLQFRALYFYETKTSNRVYLSLIAPSCSKQTYNQFLWRHDVVFDLPWPWSDGRRRPVWVSSYWRNQSSPPSQTDSSRLHVASISPTKQILFQTVKRLSICSRTQIKILHVNSNYGATLLIIPIFPKTLPQWNHPFDHPKFFPIQWRNINFILYSLHYHVSWLSRYCQIYQPMVVSMDRFSTAHLQSVVKVVKESDSYTHLLSSLTWFW